MRPLHRLPLISQIPGLLACGAAGDAPAGSAVRIDTIGGVVHVVNGGAGLWTGDERWRVDAGRAIEIGAVDGPEPYVLGEVSGVVVAEDGRIYVADAQAMEVRVFSPAGEFLSRFGREGEGPGEFRNISGLGRTPDGGVAALDGSLGRVSVFDADGGFVRSFALQRPYMILVHGALVRFDDRGRFHDRTTLSLGIGADTLGVVRYAASGAVEDTIVVAVHEPSRILVQRNGVPVASFPVPYAPEPSAAVGPDGRIYAAAGGAYAIARLGDSGDTLLVIERTVTPPAVAEAERDAALAEIRERYREIAGADPRDLPALPERKPAIVDLQVDEEGFIWVLRSSERGSASASWDAFDPEGRFLGTLDVPSMGVMHIGERSIAGATYDDLGVARVRVVPVGRGRG